MKHPLRRVATTLAFLGLATTTSVACNSDPSPCGDGDRTYEHGQVWTCSDGCNGCTCDDGTVSSTDIGCLNPPGPAAGKLMCLEGGFRHTHGETWVCADGCSACTCSDGKLSTVERECSDAGQDAQ